MIKRLARLLGQIVGRIKENMVTVFITIGMTLVSLAFSLLVWSGDRVEHTERLVFWWAALATFLLGLVAWIVSMVFAIQEYRDNRAERKQFGDSFRNMTHESKELNGNIKTLIQEIRQDRNERNRKH